MFDNDDAIFIGVSCFIVVSILAVFFAFGGGFASTESYTLRSYNDVGENVNIRMYQVREVRDLGEDRITLTTSDYDQAIEFMDKMNAEIKCSKD